MKNLGQREKHDGSRRKANNDLLGKKLQVTTITDQSCSSHNSVLKDSEVFIPFS